MKIVLASASARRQELLKRIVENFDIVVSNFDEKSVDFKGNFGEYVKELSKGKALDVLSNYRQEEALIIGCDTIVAHDGKVLGKPEDQNEAFSMLRELSGDYHEVYSGITIINTKSNLILSEALLTKVKFSELSDEEILQYINTGEPMDKAGAYGIQGYGGVFVEEIMGCYYNVVGFPINKLSKMLKSIV